MHLSGSVSHHAPGHEVVQTGVYGWEQGMWTGAWTEMCIHEVCTPRPHDDYCRGRYASYWNTFLFI